MDYIKIYSDLVNRAKIRTLPHDKYIERHHIVPKCMGGNNSKANLVKLTPEEHFVAHELLVKMYPHHKSLICALARMSTGEKRPNKRLYGWLKRRFAEYMRVSMSGRNNPNYGVKWQWIHDDHKNKMIPKNDVIPAGWSPGKIHNKIYTCTLCKKRLSKNYKYCPQCRKKNRAMQPYTGIFETKHYHMVKTKEQESCRKKKYQKL